MAASLYLAFISLSYSVLDFVSPIKDCPEYRKVSRRFLDRVLKILSLQFNAKLEDAAVVVNKLDQIKLIGISWFQIYC